MDTLFVSDLDGTLLTGDIRLTERTTAIINGLKDRIHFTIATARSADSAQLDDIITIVGLGSFDDLDTIRSRMEAIEGVHIQFSKDIYFDYHWLEITHEKATKYFGVQALRTHLGAKRVVCFGDHLNDIGLFEASDYRITVSNAVPELKEMADLVIGSNNQDAVAEYLNEQIIGNSSPV